MKPKVIIFGNNLQNTLGLIRSVGMEGYEVVLLLEPVKKSLCYVRHSKYISKIHYLSSLSDGLTILLSEYSSEKQKPIILCGSDPAICFLDSHYDELRDKFHFFNAGAQGRINYFENKTNQFEIAKKLGLDLIKTWHITDVHNIPDDISFPCLVKGNNSITSTKGDMFIRRSLEDLRNSLNQGTDYLIQEYIEKDFELNVNGFSYNKGKNVFIPAGIYKIRDGLYTQGLYMRIDHISHFQGLDVDKLKTFIGAIGYEGIFSIEFLCKSGKYYFLETNLRNDGCGWLYTAAGFNYPLMWSLYSQGKLLDKYFECIQNVKLPLYLMHENDLYNVICGKVTLLQWIKDFHRAQAFFIANSKDPMPFIFSTWIHFKQMIKKILRRLFHIKID